MPMRRPRMSRISAGGLPAQILAGQQQFAAALARVRGEVAHDRPGQGRLARPGFPDEANRLAPVDRQVDDFRASNDAEPRARRRASNPGLRAPGWLLLVRRRISRRMRNVRSIISAGPAGRSVSRSASPNRLNPIAAMAMAMPGTATHHGLRNMNWRASAIISPHSVLGGCAPRPRKPSVAPSMIAKDTRMVASTMSGPSEFGRTSDAMM